MCMIWIVKMIVALLLPRQIVGIDLKQIQVLFVTGATTHAKTAQALLLTNAQTATSFCLDKRWAQLAHAIPVTLI